MSNPKYIVVQFSPSANEFAVAFPPWETHADMARRCGGKEFVLGAGEFSIGEPMVEDSWGIKRPSVHCFGRSASLGITSRGKADASILKASLFGQG